MRKKSFITVAVVVTMCCLTMCLTGCFSNEGVADFSSPAPTTVPNSVTDIPDTTPPTQTTTSTPPTTQNNVTQTPDSMLCSQIVSPTPTAPSTPTTKSTAIFPTVF